jgi:RNA polymerase sigma-70 factor (ECF subfamily)
MTADDAETSELLRRVRAGDNSALTHLMQNYRAPLKRMVVVRLDRRLAGRMDPSDIVQEALADAARKLPAYLAKRPLPFYPWLRRLALEKLLEMRRHHLNTHKRSVLKEQLPDESLAALADQFVAKGTQPSERAVREELRNRVQATLKRLSERDREVLVLRYLEQLAPREVAAALGISQASFMKRHLRAMERLRRLLDDKRSGDKRGGESR